MKYDYLAAAGIMFVLLIAILAILIPETKEERRKFIEGGWHFAFAYPVGIPVIFIIALVWAAFNAP